MNKVFYIIIVLGIIFGSCCRDHNSDAFISISYLNLDTTSTLKAYLTERNDLNKVIDTIEIGELSEEYHHTTGVLFSDNSPNYILFIEGTRYSDTLTEIYFVRPNTSNCEELVEDFQYRFNGELRTKTYLDIE